MTSVECGGNSAPMFSNEPIQATAQGLHGLCFLRGVDGRAPFHAFDEAGVDPKAKWFIAEALIAWH